MPEALAAELASPDPPMPRRWCPSRCSVPRSAAASAAARPDRAPASALAVLARAGGADPAVRPGRLAASTPARQWIAAHSAEAAPAQHQAAVWGPQERLERNGAGARASGLQTAWLALETADNDPIRFWRYLIAACAPLQADAGAAALAQLELPPQPSFEPSPIDPAR